MFNSVPIEVFVWSPISEPTLVEPVLMGVLAVEDHRDAGVVVLQVAVGRQRAEVDPLAHVGVAQEAVVVLVGVAVDDRLLDLAAHAAHRADRVALAALRAQQDRLLADVARPFDAGEGMDLDAFVEIDRPVLGVDHDHRMDHRAGADVDVLPAAADGVGLLDLALDAAAAGGREIGRQLRRIGQHQVPGVVPRGRQFLGRGQRRPWPNPTGRRSNRSCSLPRSPLAMRA